MNDYLRLYEQGEIAFYNLSATAQGVLGVVTKQAREDKDVVIEIQHPLYWYNHELFYNVQNRINHVTSYILKKDGKDKI